ncbi:hypothetical protein M0804_009344 [Polistes exclamans]|nr:hypothetical protein M0804_009344 [Polistes exclamans]
MADSLSQNRIEEKSSTPTEERQNYASGSSFLPLGTSNVVAVVAVVVVVVVPVVVVVVIIVVAFTADI